jgi:hypothetical protein
VGKPHPYGYWGQFRYLSCRGERLFAQIDYEPNYSYQARPLFGLRLN